jgi:hypothetical protein
LQIVPPSFFVDRCHHAKRVWQCSARTRGFNGSDEEGRECDRREVSLDPGRYALFGNTHLGRGTRPVARKSQTRRRRRIRRVDVTADVIAADDSHAIAINVCTAREKFRIVLIWNESSKWKRVCPY